MEYTLFDLTILLFILSFIVRIIFVSIPAIQFVSLFERKIGEGTRLLRALEIPGFSTFIRQELVLGFLPYPLLFGIIQYNDLASLGMSELGFLLFSLTILIFLIWLLFDWWRSYSIYQQLRILEEKTKKIKSISGNALDGLRFVVHIRGSVRKTAMTLGARAAVGIAKKKVEDTENTKGKRPASILALSFIERLVSFPERVTKKLTDWAKEQIDEKLMLEFDKYASRTTSMFALLFAWSLLPCIWVIAMISVL